MRVFVFCAVLFVCFFTFFNVNSLPRNKNSWADKPFDFYNSSARSNNDLTIDDGFIVNTNPPKIAYPKMPNMCSNCICGVGRKTRIVGGTIATIGEFPWMIAMSKHGQFHCGGSLLTKRHVLTAAHCLEGFDKRHFEIFIGKQDFDKSSSAVIHRRIKSWTVHEDFNTYNLDNDIAVIELDRSIPVGGAIRTACLPENRAIDYTGSLATAIGWGRTTEGGDVSSTLRKVELPVLSDEECDEAGYQKSRRTTNMFCAGYLEGKRDACSGDSGGPLLVEGPYGHLEVIGITSFGRGCARPRYPGVYTKLTNYLGWLRDNLNGECICPPAK
ncbi:hypothetical protein G9C98_008354 [Cotesia typhae]|uniref:limulus clotting factor C n=1 Tax=Cotesia typhae TaxID=2053667 RepID=A0A8J5V648_9HYME|nr:hypothetical protein G9C98_008354 [Cotesia typhae]